MQVCHVGPNDNRPMQKGAGAMPTPRGDWVIEKAQCLQVNVPAGVVRVIFS